MKNNIISRLTLTYHQDYLQKLFLEDEIKNIRKFVQIVVIFGLVLSIILFFIGIFSLSKTQYLGISIVNVVILLFFYIKILKYDAQKSTKYFSINVYLSIFNILSAVIINYLINLVGVEDADQESLKQQQFLFGGCAYSFHISTLLGTNFVLNSITMIIISLIYIFSCFPNILLLFGFISFLNIIILINLYYTSLNKRIYYSLVNKYFIWYFITNNILQCQLILTRLKKDSDDFQLITSNKRAIKDYQLESDTDLNDLIKQITVYENKDNPAAASNEIKSNSSHKKLDAITDNKKQIIIEEQLKLDQSEKDVRNHLQQNQFTMIPNQTQIKSNLEVVMKKSMDEDPGIEQNLKNTEQIVNRAVYQSQTYEQNFCDPFPNEDYLLQKISLIKKDDKKNQLDNSNPMDLQNYSQKTRSSTFLAQIIDINSNPALQKYQMKLEMYQLKDLYHLIVIEDSPQIQDQPVISPFLFKIYENSIMFIEEALLFQSKIKECLIQIDRYLPQIQVSPSSSGPISSGDIKPKSIISQKYTHHAMKEISYGLKQSEFYNFCLKQKVQMFRQYLCLEFLKVEVENYEIYLDILIQQCIREVQNILRNKQIEIFFSSQLQQTENIIYNDERRIKLVVKHILLKSIENSNKGFIIVDLSRAIQRANVDNELLGLNSNDFSQVLQIVIRDTSRHKWPMKLNRNQYDFQKNLDKQKSILDQNKLCDLAEIQFSACQELLGKLGPYNKIFIASDEQGQQNQLSFYLFSNFQDQEAAIQKEPQISSHDFSNQVQDIELAIEQQFKSNDLEDMDVDDEQISVSEAMQNLNNSSLFNVQLSERLQRFTSIDFQVDHFPSADFQSLQDITSHSVPSINY